MPRRTPGKAPGALRTSLVLVNALVLAACADQLPTAAPGGANANLIGGSLTPSGPGRYVVGLEDGATLSGEVLAAAGATVLDSAPAVHALEVVADNPAALAGAGVRYVGRSFEFTLEAHEGEAVTADPAEDATPAGTDGSAAPWYASGVQWDMRAIGLTSPVWQGTTGGAGAKVCIIDSGIDTQHQELAGKVDAEASFVTGTSPAPLDSNGHGTHVASTVAGRGVVAGGVAPDARLMTAMVFAATGGTPVLRVTNAITWCTDNGAHVINMSLGGVRYFAPGTNALSLSDVAAYADAVRYATERGVVVAVAAGNSNIRLQGGATAQQVTVPAQVPGTIIVGATGPLSRVGQWTVDGQLATLPLTPPAWNPFDPQQVWPGQGVDGKAFYSNWGSLVHVFAPGGRGGVPAGYRFRLVADQSGARVQQTGSANDNIWAACSRFSTYTGSRNSGGAPGVGAQCRGNPSDDRYAALAGTSMAAPHVAGLAALLYSELGTDRSPARRARVEQCIRSTTDVIGPSTTFGGGRINVERALACVRG